ncbi:FAD-linked oxidase C-terminal domain-containing protein [Acuticoccus sp. MNP-M23]|uniref:FAD-binding oxidoreductase n=1 Tax=Acuticoccus sp. MNP-M23 TaxID=3072793 RepID=UPI00281684A3|nr:FAD-linked oxidase C-terminal domain-containing protein [Acuticoccus sp. MNP-M23]WMS41169.1 FAD-linked oxidase C-terminal domain-containing protein [Acuticoccus sp. MNP-M23]
MAVPLRRVDRNDDGIATAVPVLKQRFGPHCHTGADMRRQHGHTTSWLANEAPDAVVFVTTAQDVEDVLEICRTHGVPVIAFGVGTSLEGHVNAPAGGVSVDFSQMNRIIEVQDEDLTCTVEPGVTRKQLNDFLRDRGLFFPIDPGADASLGGMCATRASGTNAVRYGTMRDNVIALEAVLADGRALKTASRAKKTSAGYDLTRLLIGSEGTLGLITKITLKLHGIPEAISAAVCPFPSVEAACNATILTIQSGIPVARIELLDALQIRAVNAYAKLGLPEQPTLFLEFHGSQSSVTDQSEAVAAIAEELGGGPFSFSTRAEERNKLWQARHDSYWAALGLRPGAAGISTDVCVPISRLAECVADTQADLEELGLLAPIVGHVGDGNFHTLVLVDNDNADERAKATLFLERLAERALTMDGTCTGEHGIGQGKIKYLRRELGDTAVDVMAAIKSTLDPQNILNPGKILS